MPSVVLAEPLTLGQETIPRGTFGSGKTFFVFPFLVGFFFAVLVRQVPFAQRDITEAINMQGSPMSTSCPRTGVPTMPINAMLETMQKHGIPPSPIGRFALTSYAATRDVSMAAQAKKEFMKLDHATQDKLKKLQKEVVVRAASISAEDLPGVTKPLGFWDPAGFSKNGNIFAYRQAELKHGRVCMLASAGIIVQEKFHPFFDAWNEGPWVSSVASHFTATAEKNFWPAFWIMATGHELVPALSEYDGKDVADFGFDPLNLKPSDPDILRELQNKELNNGRLAMFAAAGALAQELVTGKSVF